MRRPRLIPDGTRPFFRYRWIAFIWSAVVLAAIGHGADDRAQLRDRLQGRHPARGQDTGPADLARMRACSTSWAWASLAAGGWRARPGPDPAEAQDGTEEQQREAIERIKGALDTQVGSGMVYQRAEFCRPQGQRRAADERRIYAVVISMAGVFAYLWFRFEWQYGIGAIALVHDVSATIAIYSLFGIEFNLTSVAAVLTLVGYSLNDTVVIYDRVRENLRRYKTMAIEELLDRSINETLARTLMTSLTTMTAWSRSGSWAAA